MDDSDSLTKDGSYKEAVRTLRHDARNLLNGIAIMAEHFEGTEDKKAARFVSYLEDKVQTMVRLGERAETFASMSAGERQSESLPSMISSILDNLGEGVKPPSLQLSQTQMLCEPQLTALALREVIDNAVKTGAPVAISSSEDGGRVVIAVSDEGPGIPEPALPHLFTPFRGAKRAGGTSLGLPIARRAMELQGGGLDLRAGDEGGTEVVCSFPA
ncbi:sensor histidine kinase [Parvularcula maris]|uniref:histidine kinase n=1 Tax=Parvularcula maris TaxID=2965077 RepID=A0A9X2L8A4_9PROT|nr:HAMP domain-containing sensor histidine kinase [Parvularcula maris]MCQ8184930.1 HAMP domain-containing histidine kinase [Parvularcula maris]